MPAGRDHAGERPRPIDRPLRRLPRPGARQAARARLPGRLAGAERAGVRRAAAAPALHPGGPAGGRLPAFPVASPGRDAAHRRRDAARDDGGGRLAGRQRLGRGGQWHRPDPGWRVAQARRPRSRPDQGQGSLAPAAGRWQGPGGRAADGRSPARSRATADAADGGCHPGLPAGLGIRRPQDGRLPADRQRVPAAGGTSGWQQHPRGDRGCSRGAGVPAWPPAARRLTGPVPTFPGPAPTFPGPAPTFPGPAPTFPGPAPTFPGPARTFAGPARTFADPARPAVSPARPAVSPARPAVGPVREAGGGAAVTADEFRLELVTQPVPPPPGADPELDDGQHTGRWNYDQLHKTEKTHMGTLVEINLHRRFGFEDGDVTDYRIAGIEVDCKYSMSYGGWELPPEAVGHICLLLTASDIARSWSAGLIRIREDDLRGKPNRDAKRQLTAASRGRIRRLWRDRGRLTANLLLSLDPATRDRIFGARVARGPSCAGRASWCSATRTATR